MFVIGPKCRCPDDGKHAVFEEAHLFRVTINNAVPLREALGMPIGDEGTHHAGADLRPNEEPEDGYELYHNYMRGEECKGDNPPTDCGGTCESAADGGACEC